MFEVNDGCFERCFEQREYIKESKTENIKGQKRNEWGGERERSDRMLGVQ